MLHKRPSMAFDLRWTAIHYVTSLYLLARPNLKMINWFWRRLNGRQRKSFFKHYINAEFLWTDSCFARRVARVRLANVHWSQVFGQINCRLMDVSAFLHLSTVQSLKNDDKNLFFGSWGQRNVSAKINQASHQKKKVPKWKMSLACQFTTQ